MTEKNGFFSPGDFDFFEEESDSLKKEDIDLPEKTDVPEENSTLEKSEVSREAEVSEKIVLPEEKKPESFEVSFLEDTVIGNHNYMSEEQIRKYSGMLKGSSDTSVIHNAHHFESPKESAVVRFESLDKGISCDIEVPLDISANDLVIGLNEAFHLGIDISDIKQCYLASESPIALIKGKKLLGEFGVRDGTLIIFSR